MSAAIRGAAVGAVLLAALAWPALYNGQPIFFGDTSAYIRGADAGVQAVFHRRSSWSLQGGNAIVERPRQPGPGAARTAAPRAAQISHGNSIADKSILYGRSPYYGALLYLGDLAGGFWLTVALQSLAVLVALALVLRVLGTPLWPLLPITAALSAAATTAPFFVSFLMPDIFAAIGILAAATLLTEHGRHSRTDTGIAFVLLCLCVVFHDSHVLIAAALLVVALVRNVVRRSWANGGRVAAVALALGVAVLAQVGFSAAVQRVIGAAPVRPPFLMGRMIEDGPGYQYLRETCPGNGLEVCAFMDRLPMPANLFVWQTGPRGVFGNASPEVRRRLADEQVRFAWGVITHHPVGELWASLSDVGSLLTMSGLNEFQYDGGEKQSFARKIPAAYLQTLRRTPAYRGTMPLTFFATLSYTTFVLGAGLVIVALIWRDIRLQLPLPLVEMVAWMLTGVLANALVCGILSGPHNRYAARVSWLLPFAGLLIGIALSRARRSRTEARAAILPAGLVPDAGQQGRS